MLPAWFRLIAAPPFLAAGIALVATGHPWGGAAVASLGVLLLAAWVRYGDVPRAGKAFNAGDRERAWLLLSKTPFRGRFLATPVRVYFHQVRASCLLKWERWEEAARESEAVLALRATDEQKASSHASAALARVEMGDDAMARQHYAAAKGLPHSDVLSRRLARLAPRLEGASAGPGVTGA